MSNAELNDWRKFYQRSPWGTEVEDDRFGLILSAMQSLSGGEFRPPSEWFPRNKSQASKQSDKNKMVMAEKARLAFREFSARQVARQAEADDRQS